MNGQGQSSSMSNNPQGQNPHQPIPISPQNNFLMNLYQALQKNNIPIAVLEDPVARMQILSRFCPSLNLQQNNSPRPVIIPRSPKSRGSKDEFLVADEIEELPEEASSEEAEFSYSSEGEYEKNNRKRTQKYCKVY